MVLNDEFRKELESKLKEAISEGYDDEVSHIKALLASEKIREVLSIFNNETDYSYRRKLLKDMSFLEYKNLLISLNGCYNDNEGKFDGHDASWGLNYQTPHTDDKSYSIELVFNTMKKYINDENLTDIQAILYASSILSDGGLIVHPFKDGNGRTHRLISYSIMNGCPNLEKTIDLCRHREGQRISPVGGIYVEACREYWHKYLEEELERMNVKIVEDKHYSLEKIFYLHLKGDYNPDLSFDEYVESLDEHERNVLNQTMAVIYSRAPIQGFIMAVDSNAIDDIFHTPMKLYEHSDHEGRGYKREKNLRRYLQSYFGYEISDDEYNSIRHKLPCLDKELLWKASVSEDIPLLDKPLFKEEYLIDNSLDELETSKHK